MQLALMLLSCGGRGRGGAGVPGSGVDTKRAESLRELEGTELRAEQTRILGEILPAATMAALSDNQLDRLIGDDGFFDYDFLLTLLSDGGADAETIRDSGEAIEDLKDVTEEKEDKEDKKKGRKIIPRPEHTFPSAKHGMGHAVWGDIGEAGRMSWIRVASAESWQHTELDTLEFARNQWSKEGFAVAYAMTSKNLKEANETVWQALKDLLAALDEE